MDCKIYTDIETSYIPSEDITIVWQNMYKYVEGEGDELIQRNLIGWYHGEPDDHTTPHYSNAPLTAYFVDCENC